MMREIEFRAWYKPEKYMLSGDELTAGTDESLNQYFKDNEYVFMQFTGLRDKNGVKIFEGDIIAHEGIVKPGAVVTWSDIYGGYSIGKNWPFCEFIYGDISDCEVIGNIYENPELLDEN